ncbi:hypothetical protein NP493_582g00020 [Ridgeia piscesae]|uniref:Uncharacterized protein n=1 Tax=Ridgeia piscesae TaxID=27915 RepID=A0AAD9KU46_RIDPI|nr:hypothetical protein NP493_582g00020 [Ridgeia piscesae]
MHTSTQAHSRTGSKSCLFYLYYIQQLFFPLQSRLYSPNTNHSRSFFSLGPKRQQHRHTALQPPVYSCPGDISVELHQISPKSGAHNNRNCDNTRNGQAYIARCHDCGAAHKGDGKWAARNGERREIGKWRRKNMVFSKLFTFRKSRKPAYRQLPGDLRASDITMSESDRIQLMVMVKEGKISTEEALQEVKRYEEKVHEDFLRDMEVTHATEVKVSYVMVALCYHVYLF